MADQEPIHYATPKPRPTRPWPILGLTGITLLLAPWLILVTTRIAIGFRLLSPFGALSIIAGPLILVCTVGGLGICFIACFEQDDRREWWLGRVGILLFV